MQESAVTLSSVEVYGKTQTQKVKEGAFAVNALDIKPIVNSLNNLNDLVNRTTGIQVREEGGEMCIRDRAYPTAGASQDVKSEE